MPEEVLPGVHDVTVMEGEGRRFRVYLFEDPVPTLVDTGLGGTTDALFEGLDALDVEPERVVVTHNDGDHTGGLPAVVDKYDPEVFVPEQTEESALGGVDPDVRYGDGDTIGDFEAVHVPGHEPDNHALVDESRGVVVAGDAVSGSDQRGLPAGYLLLPPAVYSDDLNEAEASLERLLDYEFDAVLVFHGSSVLDGGHEKLDAFVNFPGKPS
ncbi:Glyoxylase, beta-lactamase superfamily II [Halogranum rubrum]|uniref:Glyoxylase, beta-lactamase superfamily II n=1 Tax=Halogranum rubrum TaxID=553466 RepID=A0A1I4E1F3_9EURY|nr:MBL fold metallo-hydrolase [Halogranum rubrum]SFK99053.1 Glyoxylase, beta-lactamase superfamily II [Halogranum rubrum]